MFIHTKNKIYCACIFYFVFVDCVDRGLTWQANFYIIAWIALRIKLFPLAPNTSYAIVGKSYTS